MQLQTPEQSFFYNNVSSQLPIYEHYPPSFILGNLFSAYLIWNNIRDFNKPVESHLQDIFTNLAKIADIEPPTIKLDTKVISVKEALRNETFFVTIRHEGNTYHITFYGVKK